MQEKGCAFQSSRAKLLNHNAPGSACTCRSQQLAANQTLFTCVAEARARAQEAT